MSGNMYGGMSERDIEREVERIMGLSELEIRNEIFEMGEDPELVVVLGRFAVKDALERSNIHVS